MPGGSDYPGPPAALATFLEVVAASEAGAEVKGAKNPYTSRNGHMFSFLDPEGRMALRLSEELADEFMKRYESGPVMAYGKVMRGYVSVPAELFENPSEMSAWFDRAYEWIGTLKPKPPTKS